MGSKTTPINELCRRANAAEDALEVMTPDADDIEIARAVADYLLAKRPPHHLSIFHDVRPSAPKRVARIRKDFPNYQGQPHGPCPLHYDWQRKNMVGISTRARDSGSLTRCCWAMACIVTSRRTAAVAVKAQLPPSARVRKDWDDCC